MDGKYCDKRADKGLMWALLMSGPAAILVAGLLMLVLALLF